MHHSFLREALRKQPFVPFRLHMTNGTTYDVPSPEWMMVTNLYTTVAIPGQSGDGELVTYVDNWHITQLELLPTVKTPA